jgi:hypothetical protein
MRHVLALLMLLAPMNASFAQDTGQILSDRIERDEQGVGIVAATIENDTPQFTSFGMAKADGDTPVNEGTLFEIGSISKLFGNLLLAQMVLDGTMDLVMRVMAQNPFTVFWPGSPCHDRRVRSSNIPMSGRFCWPRPSAIRRASPMLSLWRSGSLIPWA